MLNNVDITFFQVDVHQLNYVILIILNGAKILSDHEVVHEVELRVFLGKIIEVRAYPFRDHIILVNSPPCLFLFEDTETEKSVDNC